MKLIIAGGRDFKGTQESIQAIHDVVYDQRSVLEVVCGGARGADAFGKEYAVKYGAKVALFPANWDLYGKSAGYRRNEEMAKYATHLIAFWDGKSRGTKHMIDLAKRYKLDCTVIGYSGYRHKTLADLAIWS